MLLDHLNHLEISGLIRLVQSEPELEYLFRHALVQEAAYESMLKEDRRRLHQAVGETLETLYADQLEELAATLAHHFALAEDAPRALHYLVLAGDAAFHRYAVSEAIAHYARALETARQIGETAEVPWSRLYQNLGRALELDAQYERALQTYEEMGAQARARDDREMELVALTEHAKVHATPNLAHDTAEGQALAERALALARELGDRPAEARIEWVLLIVNWLRSDPRESLEHGKRSLSLARELNLREQLAYTVQDIHRPLALLGQLDESRAALDEARGLWRELNNLPMLADNLASTADLLTTMGDFSAALEFAAEAWRVSQSIGNLWNQAFGRAMMGEIHQARGEFGAALAALEEARELSERAGLVILTMRIYRRLADLYLELNILDRAHEMALRSEGDDQMDAGLRESFRLDALLGRCLVEVRAGQAEAAAAHLEQALQLYPAAPQLRPLGLAQTQAEMSLAQENYQQALTIVDEFLEDAGGHIVSQALPRVYQIQARALLGLGRLEEALTALRRAEEPARALGLRHRLWQILVIRGRCESLRRNAEAAAAAFEEARRLIEATAADIGDAAQQASFLARPDVRALLDL
jgi:tetratricopeptide (TPR) repeat protein